MPDFRIIILAAGEGKRMNAGQAKVLVKLRGRPMLLRVLDAVKASGVDAKPIVVIAAGQRGEEVKHACASYDVTCVVQSQQLGTGHAVQVCQSVVGDAGHVMVLYGDQPLIKAATIKRLADEHAASGNFLTMASATVADFSDWRSSFKGFGRILRNQTNEVIAIIESKDAAPEQLESEKEVNPAYFCFQASRLWQELKKLNTNNAQAELYLTDLVALTAGEPKTIINIDPVEALGINSPEGLAQAEALLNAE
jgi:bifunctional UDP-N-acetylglucosamine pyrophosphorylase/glucosamine-1-phosphate N-acetyltransferase